MSKQRAEPRAVKAIRAAEMMGIARSTLSDLCKNGQIAHIRVGRTVLIRVAEIDKWLAAHETPATAEKSRRIGA